MVKHIIKNYYFKKQRSKRNIALFAFFISKKTKNNNLKQPERRREYEWM